MPNSHSNSNSHSTVPISIWHGCYDSNLKSLITPASFAHPAKLARTLCERIFDHGRERGYWQPGDLILDPFAGVFTVGLIGAYRGYRVVGVELEPRFVEMAQANIDKNRRKLQALGKPLPVVLQGDSRHLLALLSPSPDLSGEGRGGGVSSAISSPPYVDQRSVGGGERCANQHTNQSHTMPGNMPQYGDTPGQIGHLNEGDLDGVISYPPYAEGLGHDTGHPRLDAQSDAWRAEHGYQRVNGYQGVISSPPYADSVNQSDGANDSTARLHRKEQSGVDISQAINRGGPNSVLNQAQAYGSAEGQIGTLHNTDFDATLSLLGRGQGEGVSGAVTSPPYEATNVEQTHMTSNKRGDLSDPNYRPSWKKKLGDGYAETRRPYGTADGQIGALHGGDPTTALSHYPATELKETYWQAMAQVYSQLYAVLKPGGVVAIVCKDFVRDKQRVPLCDMTARLLEAIGFTIIERTHAMLVKESQHPALLSLDDTSATVTDLAGKQSVRAGQSLSRVVTKKTERKSFFRRLAESKGSPAIDYEVVIWARKPCSLPCGSGGGQGRGS